MSVTVVGSINADLLISVDQIPRPGETRLGGGGSTAPGGKGANQALAAQLGGAATHMVGAVGTDSLAEAALALLREAGVNLDSVMTVEGPTGLAVVMTDAHAENSIVVVPGANAAVTPEVVDQHAEVISQAAIVVVQGEIPPASVAAVASRTRGRLLVNLAPVVALPAEVLRQGDPLVVNEHEGVGALAILRGHAADDSEQSLVQALLDSGVSSVVMTLGSRGCLIGSSDGVRALPAPKMDAVDTVGAGDAFAGALAAHLAAGEDLDAAAAQATRFAAASVMKAGAQPSYPRRGTGLPE